MIDSNIISDGHTVIAQLHDGTTHILQICKNREQKVCRMRLNVNPIIGCPYGSIFEITNKRKLERLEDDTDLLETLDNIDINTSSNNHDNNSNDSNDESNNEMKSKNVGNNSDYVDSNTAQKLSMDEVVKLRQSGVSGVDIIKSLIENSDTWAQKTEFAQEKWLKRKQKKYLSRFRVIKCNPMTICEVYHNKNRDKICGLRWDTLAQILSYSGIHSNRKILIFESCIGLLIGSAAYRMRGSGRILAVYGGQQPHYEIVHYLNLDEKSLDIIKPISSTELAPAASYVKSNGFLDPLTLEDDSDVNLSTENSDQNDNIEDENSENKKKRTRTYNSSGRQIKDLVKLRHYLREGSESLVIASKFHPLPILMESLVLLAPSSPIVIYHEFIEPLLECYDYLQLHDLCIRMTLSDTWFREFQVLPGRTHPNMYVSGSGGYLLYGTYVGMTAVVAIKVLITTIF